MSRARVVFLPLRDASSRALYGVRRADKPLVLFWYEREMPCRIKGIVYIPWLFYRCNPFRSEAREIEWVRIRTESLYAVRVEEDLVKIGHHELAGRFIDRVAIAEHGVVRLAHGAPEAVFPEQSDSMSVVRSYGYEVEKERRMPVVPQHGRRE